MIAANAFKRDPTKTVTLRKEFAGAVAHRFMRIAGALREFTVDLDGFGLGDKPRGVSGLSINERVDIATLPKRLFQFDTNPEKLKEFQAWLREMKQAEVLDWFEEDGRKYLNTGYKRGIQHAQTQGRAAGVTFPNASPLGSPIDGAMVSPIHAERVEMLYTRTLSDLEGITDAMNQRLSRVLGQGLTEGKNPLTIARDLAHLQEGGVRIGIVRGRMLARTEIIRVHADGSLNEYERSGLEGVELEAELSTAGDDLVCDECQSLAAAGTITIEEARGRVPVHPNCRCAWKPVVK